MMPEVDQLFEQISVILGNVMSVATDQISSSSGTKISVIGI